jgi:hypothetical protein
MYVLFACVKYTVPVIEESAQTRCHARQIWLSSMIRV